MSNEQLEEKIMKYRLALVGCLIAAHRALEESDEAKTALEFIQQEILTALDE